MHGALIVTADPRHLLLVRRHLRTGELAFHYCFVPDRQPLTMTRLVRAAGLRWPVEEDFEFGNLDSANVRPGCTPLSCVTPCWSSPPWPCAPWPPHDCVTAPTPRPGLPPPGPGPATGSWPDPVDRARDQTLSGRRAGPAETSRSWHSLDDLAAASPGPFALVPLNAPDSAANTPWSTNHWRLAY
jgi:hypothetical protein